MKYLFRIIALLCCVFIIIAGCANQNDKGDKGTSPSPEVAGTSIPASPQGSPQARKVQLPENIQDGSSTLKIYVVEGKEIKKMSMNEYLYGVLAGEMKADWPQEALRAQAIIARTYLLEYLASEKKSKYEGADISTDVKESQAYNAEGINDAVKEAVDSTDGQAILFEGNFIRAWFHSCSGGITAAAIEGLENEDEPGYIKIVESDESAAPDDIKSWQKEFTKESLIAALTAMEEDVSEFSEVKISEEGPSGRAVRISFGEAEVSAAALRVALGANEFRSTLIDEFEFADGVLRVSGKGFGHGVGMSQWGAKKMAEDGKTAQDIINFYYNNIEIAQIWG